MIDAAPSDDAQQSDQAAVEVEGLSLNYGSRAILRDVSFEVRPGQSLAISGSTGSGKSTILSVLAGMLKFRQGDVRVAGLDIRRSRSSDLATMRLLSLGMVHQHGELISSLSARENVMVPILLAGRLTWTEAHKRATDLCQRFGVASLDIAADSLSGGERQRVALARALANEPSVLVADEPTASLDPEMSDRVAEATFALASEAGCAVIVVTHDPDVASRADRRAVLSDAHLRVVDGA